MKRSPSIMGQRTPPSIRQPASPPAPPAPGGVELPKIGESKKPSPKSGAWATIVERDRQTAVATAAKVRMLISKAPVNAPADELLEALLPMLEPEALSELRAGSYALAGPALAGPDKENAALVRAVIVLARALVEGLER